ncbi:MAG: DUF3127 domain-containing protein [Candidatus Kapaibacterium sp.]
MNFKLSGKLVEKFDTQQISDSFRKREFVLETEENSGYGTFNEYIKFQLIQDKCDIIEPHQINDMITVNFNIKGKKWEKGDKTAYFTNLDAWKIEAEENSPMPGGDMPMPGDEDYTPPAEDDLPF